MCEFILILGEMIQFDEHMFQLGGSVRTAPSIWDCFLNRNPIETLEPAVPDDPHVALLNLSIIRHRDEA